VLWQTPDNDPLVIQLKWFGGSPWISEAPWISFP